MYGGGEMLILRCIGALTRRGYNVSLIDFEDGFVAKRVKDCTVISYSAGSRINISDHQDSVIIMNPGSVFPLLECEIQANLQVVMWQVHPYEILFYLIPGGGFLIEKVGVKVTKNILRFLRLSRSVARFLDITHKKGGLVFMDAMNKEANEYLFGRPVKQPNYLPIPADGAESESCYSRSEKDYSSLELFYLGRIEEFKTATLEKLILDSYCFSKKNKTVHLSLSVIGDGKDLEKTKKMTTDLLHDNFTVKFLGKKTVPESVNALKKCHILFAMGTAALEGAKISVPVVITDLSYKKIGSDYKYRWLYKTQDYNLAGIYRVPFYKQEGGTLSNIIEEYYKDKEKKSTSSYNYFKENHDINKVIDRVEGVILKSELSISDLKESVKFSKSMGWQFLNFLTMAKGNQSFKKRLSQRNKVF